MQSLRQHKFLRIFWLIMAFHILNCSVDTPDLKPNIIPEDLSYNDMESVAEIVLEKVFNIEDAVAEHDENDTEESNSFNIKKDFSFHNRIKSEKIKIVNFGNSISISTEYIEQFNSQYLADITPPPPKA